MEKIKKSRILDKSIELPTAPGYFYFAQQQQVMFVSYSSNLQRAITAYFSQNPEDKNIMQLVSLTDTIGYATSADLFGAFAQSRWLLASEQPEFNQMLQPYSDFAYLAVDFHNPPFFKMVENTQEEYFYLGPFENRFLVLDYLDLLNQLEKLPNCPPDKYPCQLLKSDDCVGSCLQDNPQKTAMILQNYIFPNPELIQKWEARRQDLMDDLQFAAAELIRKQLRTLESYQQRLRFLFVSKDLNLDFEYEELAFQIKQGLISKIKRAGKEMDFPLRDLEFRSNEFLALEKDNLAEAYLIYRQVQKLKPELIEELYQKNIKILRERLQ
ncbi:MAG: hypothetical protein R6U84_06295 [Candidatus Cloacimonadales bacterium]